MPVMDAVKNPAVGPEATDPTVPVVDIVKTDPVAIEEVTLALDISMLAIGYVDAASLLFAEEPSANQTPFRACHKPPELDVPNDPEVVLLKLSENDEKAPLTARYAPTAIAASEDRIGDIFYLLRKLC
jgi:hypothetical protein